MTALIKKLGMSEIIKTIASNIVIMPLPFVAGTPVV